MTFAEYTLGLLAPFETYLAGSLPQLAPQAGKLEEAMRYSLLAGGKRLRPQLLLTTLEAAGQDPAQGYGTAAAIEYIHTYSLIHDDLPCMDNDDLRRGLPTNHIVFGEDVALLAGDGLLTEAFHLLAQQDQLSSEVRLRLVLLLSQKAGNFGMVAGQAADITANQQSSSTELLEFIHFHKTGQLITASLEAGGIIAGLAEPALQQLRSFGEHLGRCFQIQDDILDCIGNDQELGKPAGSDERNQKLTFPSLFGLEASRSMARQALDQALAALAQTGLQQIRLRELAEFVLSRNK